MDPLTPEQLLNWRDILHKQIGKYAYEISDQRIQEYRDKLQEYVDTLPEEEEDELYK